MLAVRLVASLLLTVDANPQWLKMIIECEDRFAYYLDEMRTEDETGELVNHMLEVGTTKTLVMQWE